MAGLTVADLFSSWLGSEDVQFVDYHVRRTFATVIVHSLLPLGFFAGLLVVQGYRVLLALLNSPPWVAVFALSILFPVFQLARVWSWRRNFWENHPLMKSLAAWAVQDRTVREVTALINAEFRQ